MWFSMYLKKTLRQLYAKLVRGKDVKIAKFSILYSNW